METFPGYRRADGRVGVRNHLAVMPTVSCANGVASLIQRAMPDTVPLYHGQGCGRGGRDLDLHIRTLTHLGRHPNVAAVLVVGLGCEVIKAEYLAAAIADSGKPVASLEIQSEGGSRRAAARGVELLQELAGQVAGLQPVEVGLDRLMLGLQCGGSDAFSGVSANPGVGLVADWVVQAGGTVILTENTEMIGTSHILQERACCPEVAERIDSMITAAERRTHEILGPLAGMVIAPGNMDGGMSNIREKSLGCITKAGSTPVMQVVDYAEIPSSRGLILMDAPGYDTESMTGLAAAGVQVILFTTGRGNPIGFPLVPVIKIAATGRLYESMRDDMDVNAGKVLEGASLEDVAADIRGCLRRVLAGEPSAAERNGQAGILCLYTSLPSF